MTHNLKKPLVRALSVLALSAFLHASSAAQTATAPKKHAAEKKSEAQKKPAGRQKPGPSTPQGPQQTPQAQEVTPSILVRWEGKPGVNRYRLQVARDREFQDVVFDQAVEGRQYVVKGLPPGDYFWRVAPAAAETSAAYSQPERVNLSGSSPKVEVASVLMPADSAGWRTATGEVVRLVPAQLRTGAVVDFVGVASDGRTFAVDGASGISLWNARYNAAAGAATPAESKAASFAPIVVRTKQGESDVVVAMAGGVRALRGETGKEIWRASLEGRAASGVAADVDGDGNLEVVVLTDGPERFYVLDSSSGRVVANQKLDGEAAGAPCPLNSGSTRGVVVGLKKGRVELRGADGAVVAQVKVEGEVTTSPLVVTRAEMPFLVVGTNNGLWAMSVPDLKVLGVIKAEDDSVRGSLAAADVDGDGSPEIALVTKRGR